MCDRTREIRAWMMSGSQSVHSMGIMQTPAVPQSPGAVFSYFACPVFPFAGQSRVSRCVLCGRTPYSTHSGLNRHQISGSTEAFVHLCDPRQREDDSLAVLYGAPVLTSVLYILVFVCCICTWSTAVWAGT